MYKKRPTELCFSVTTNFSFLEQLLNSLGTPESTDDEWIKDLMQSSGIKYKAIVLLLFIHCSSSDSVTTDSCQGLLLLTSVTSEFQFWLDAQCLSYMGRENGECNLYIFQISLLKVADSQGFTAPGVLVFPSLCT